MDYRIFALGSAAFAALTVLFGKIGATGVPSNLATFVRTVVILILIAPLLTARGEWSVEAPHSRDRSQLK